MGEKVKIAVFPFSLAIHSPGCILYALVVNSANVHRSNQNGEFELDTSDSDVCIVDAQSQTKNINSSIHARGLRSLCLFVCVCVLLFSLTLGSIMAYFENRSLLKSDRSYAKPQNIPSTSSNEWSSSYSSESSVSRSYR